ncbi:uncharacterized protein LOC135815839 [Sycon ciliatum]|uniref:uncharacterized protein LOC135815839 n=1 Tax=Sycon ciliatum TaxID=27933 RepID=UPI0031F5F40D
MNKGRNGPRGQQQQQQRPVGGRPRKGSRGPPEDVLEFDEIRFPVRLSSDPDDDFDDYEFVAEVTTPNGGLEEGTILVKGETLLVRYRPLRAGKHVVKALADGTGVCPPQHYLVKEDGSCQRINAKTSRPSSADAKGAAARPGSAGSSRSRSSSVGSAGGDVGLRRAESNLSRASRMSETSLDRLANAPTQYSVPGSPSDGPSSRRSSTSSRASGEDDAFEDEEDDAEEEPDEEEEEEDDDDEDEDEYDDDPAYEVPRPEPSGRYRQGAGGATGDRSQQQSNQRAPPRLGQSAGIPPGRSRGGQQPQTQHRTGHRSVSTSAIANSRGSSHGGAQTRNRSASHAINQLAQSQATEVFTSPSGNMFIFQNGQTHQLKNMGQSASGSTLAKGPNGKMWMVRDGVATPSQPQGSQKMSLTISEGDGTGLQRCAACYRKLKKKKDRARVDQLHFCRKHFKKMFCRRPAYEHKRFLEEAPQASDWSDLPIPTANFTGLSFKEYHKAQAEFSKYDPDGSRVVNIGLARPLLTNRLQAHPLKEDKVRQYMMTQRFNKSIYDMGVHQSEAVTELQFLNLLAMVVREMTQKWMKKVSMEMQPMQKSWSTSALEQGQRPAGSFSQQYVPYPGQAPNKYGLTPGRSGFRPVNSSRSSGRARAGSGGQSKAQSSEYASLQFENGRRKLPAREDPEGLAEEEDAYDRLQARHYSDEEEPGDKKTYTIFETDEPNPTDAEASVAVLDDDDAEEDEDDIEEDEDDVEEGISKNVLADALGDDDDDEDDDDDDEDEDSSISVPITGDSAADSWLMY